MYSEKGFTYIWMMFAVALAGIALAGAGQLWQTEARREKEKELMFVGEQFRLAIESYYESSPGAKRYPDSLEKLLFDNRFPTITRHLRKVFYDPMTGIAQWGLIKRPGAGVVGVHSLSTQKPLKQANFQGRYASFAGAESYRNWEFIYLPADTSGAAKIEPQSGSQLQSGFDERPEPRIRREPRAEPDQGGQPQTEPR